MSNQSPKFEYYRNKQKQGHSNEKGVHCKIVASSRCTEI